MYQALFWAYIHARGRQNVPALLELPFFSGAGGWMMNAMDKLDGRLEGSKCYGDKQGRVRGPFVLFRSASRVLLLLSLPHVYIFLLLAGLLPSSSSYSVLPASSFLPVPPSSPLPAPSILSLSPQTVARRRCSATVNSPFTGMAELLQTLLLIFTGLKASPFSLIIS